jgi:hypothetical protein
VSLKRWDGTQWVVVAGSRPGATGATGATGPQGPSGTITIGTVTAVAAGNPPTVTNTGTTTAAVLNFTIPAGATGATGAAGAAGTPGTRGSKIYTGQVAPASNGGLVGILDGDNYLNLANGNYYVYSSSSTSWILQGNIMGPTGPAGATGPAGPQGPTVSSAINILNSSVNAFVADQYLNLGIYYPKYTTLTNLTQLKAKITATSMIF